MLQANPGLTPSLVKAILQYTAQPLPNLAVIQQGTGLLNVDGAVRVAKSLRSDIANFEGWRPPSRYRRSLPSSPSNVNGDAVRWSGIITAGGVHVVGGSALLEKYQGFYDANFVWVRRLIMRTTPVPFAGTSGLPRAFVQRYAPKTKVLTTGVKALDAAAGRMNVAHHTGGWFAPVSVLASAAQSQSTTLSQGMTLADGMTSGRWHDFGGQHASRRRNDACGWHDPGGRNDFSRWHDPGRRNRLRQWDDLGRRHDPGRRA
jgi:hypothetical protein